MERPNQQEASSRAWPRIYKDLRSKAASRRWLRVGGHMAAVIATLLDAEWEPREATRWHDPQGKTWGIDAYSSPDTSPILAAVAATLKSQVCTKAAKHHNGKGAEQGLDLRGLRNEFKTLRRKGNHEWHGLLHAVATGATWTRQRRHEAYPSIDPVCRRCTLEEPETDFHRCWTCPANNLLPECMESADLIHIAAAEHRDCPIFWLRGCTPVSWTTPPAIKDSKHLVVNYTGDDGRITGQPYVVGAGDGSGGACSGDPRLRRAGYGVYIPNGDTIKPARACWGTVDGKQTVPRGELTAFLTFLRHTDGPSCYICDASTVEKGFRRLQRDGRAAPGNTDLWQAIKKELDGREIKVIRVDSHMEKHLDDMDATKAWHTALNKLADTLATAGAKLNAVDEDKIKEIRAIHRRAAKIRQRIAAATLDAINRDPVARAQAPRAEKITVESLAATTSHIISRRGTRWHCSTCAAQVSAVPRVLKPWLKTPCRPAAIFGSGGAQLARIGQRSSHHTHHCTWYPGCKTWLCSACGYSATSSLRSLARPCPVRHDGLQITSAGKKAIARINKGLMPGHSREATEFNMRKVAMMAL